VRVKEGACQERAIEKSLGNRDRLQIFLFAVTPPGAGFADFSFTLWQGIFAPHGTPPDVIAKLNSEINKVLNDPETKAKLVDAGAEIEAMSVAQFRAFVDGESAKYLRIIKETGVTAE
jgi:tripartite-type tricarboxylate transporter receptor subunit TctC